MRRTGILHATFAFLAALLTFCGEAGAARIDWFLQPVWDRASRFSEGVAAVCSGGRWGFIDPAG
ncbi:WG repeat-containing protein, partial [uncultured Fretibacterium sp.]|uniref:WG repeat-containing protein n=1 Tax=uncultured Fretibacterium sp. TaxID=1678694 RepID=UPI002616F729